MDANKIKKALYKEKPMAHKQHSNGLVKVDVLTETYVTVSSLGVHTFEVPVSEMGEVPFENHIPAQLLIRWLV